MDLATSSLSCFTWADAIACFSCILITSAGDYKSDAVAGAAASRLLPSWGVEARAGAEPQQATREPATDVSAAYGVMVHGRLNVLRAGLSRARRLWLPAGLAWTLAWAPMTAS